MPFENKNRGTDKNVGNKAQSSSNVDFTRQRIGRMLEEAKESPSTSKDTKVHSLKALLERNGSTAPDSKIPLTDKGLLGGCETPLSRELDQQAEARNELAETQARARADLEQEHRQAVREWRDRTDRGQVSDPDGTQFAAMQEAHTKRVQDMIAAHDRERLLQQNRHQLQLLRLQHPQQ